MTGELTATKTAAKTGIKPLLAPIITSFGTGAFGFAGLVTFFSYYAIAVFHEFSRHPYLYKFLMVLGALYFMLFATAIALWIASFIKSSTKLKAIGVSALSLILGCVAGFFLNEAILLIAESAKSLVV